MDPIARAAFIIAQAACMQARIAAMQAENSIRQSRGEAPAYSPDAFDALSLEFGVDHNHAIEYLRS